MDNTDERFIRLIAEVKAGSDEAFHELLRQQGDEIYRTIRRKLHRQLRVNFDSQDFFQAVWASFFAHRDAFSRFTRPEQLVAFLCAVASNKVIDECRRRLIAEKRNLNREQSLDNSVAVEIRAPAAHVATPSEVAIANEQLERLIAGEPEHYKRIVRLRADGATYGEIAETVGMNAGNVRRVIRKLFRKLA